MAGVMSTARQPFDDLASRGNEDEEQQHSEMVKLTMELFGDSISPDDLLKVGGSERAARIAFHLLAGFDHDFDDDEFREKLDRFMALLRARDDAPFEANAFIVESIKELREEADFGRREATFTAEQDVHLYVQYNKLGAEKMRNVKKHDVKKNVVIAGKTAKAIENRVRALRTSLNHLGERRNQGAIGDEAFKPRYTKKNRKVRLNCTR